MATELLKKFHIASIVTTIDLYNLYIDNRHNTMNPFLFGQCTWGFSDTVVITNCTFRSNESKTLEYLRKRVYDVNPACSVLVAGGGFEKHLDMGEDAFEVIQSLIQVGIFSVKTRL